MNYSLLYSQLDPEKLFPKLPEKGLIDGEDLEAVESFHQKFAKNAYVIPLLLWYDRPSHGLLKFCDSLETTPGQEHLGRKLLKGMSEPIQRKQWTSQLSACSLVPYDTNHKIETLIYY